MAKGAVTQAKKFPKKESLSAEFKNAGNSKCANTDLVLGAGHTAPIMWVRLGDSFCPDSAVGIDHYCFYE